MPVSFAYVLYTHFTGTAMIDQHQANAITWANGSPDLCRNRALSEMNWRNGEVCGTINHSNPKFVSIVKIIHT